MPKNKKSLDTVFVIFDTEDKKLWNSNGKKIGWISSGAAKNAWNLCQTRDWDDDNWKKTFFDEQDRYVIVPIHELLIQSFIN